MESFSRKAEQYLINAREHQGAMVGQRQVADMFNNTYQEAKAVFKDQLARGISPVAVGQAMNTIASKLNLTGASFKEINGTILEAAAAESMDRGDTTAFDALRYVETGGGTLADTKEATILKKQIEDDIIQHKHQQAVWDRTEKEQQRS